MSKPPTPRMRRVNSILREAIAEHLRDLKDPRLGFVTVTGVDTAPDLRHAVVFVSVLGDEEDHRESLAALSRASSRIRREIAPEVRLKYLPELHFRADTGIERGMRISELLRDIADREGRPTEEDGAAGPGRADPAVPE